MAQAKITAKATRSSRDVVGGLRGMEERITAAGQPCLVDLDPTVLNPAAIGEVEPDPGEGALLDGEQMHRQRLQAVGRDQLDVVVQEQKQVAVFRPAPR